jgi:HEAT repeat protein
MVKSTGIPAEKARGQSLAELLPDIETRGMVPRFERVLAEGVVEVLAPTFHHYLISCATVEPTKHFDRMQQRATIAPLRERESIVGTIVTIEDVTARLDRERDLTEQLASPDEPTRLRAAQALAQEEGSSAQRLMGSLGDESWRVRRMAVDGIARRAGADEIDTLLRALREEHHNPGVLNSALQVLALSGIDAITPLAEFLSDPDVDLRIYAAHALGDQHDPRAIPVLARALGDRDANVRYHAIESLGKLRAADAVDALASIAESRDFFLAFPALDALKTICDARIAPRIVPLLEDEMLCSPAADALGLLGDEDIIAPLAALLNKPHAPAQVVARSLAALYDRYERSFQEGAHIADLTRRAVSDEGVRNLLDAIDRTDGEELGALALVLGWMEGEAVERALVSLLGQPKVRKEVVEALVRYGERVTQLLIEQLQVEDTETRNSAVVALGRIGDASAVPALVRVLTDDAELTVAAAGALGRIGDRRAFVALLDMIGHADAAVRQAAVSALNSLGHPEMAARATLLLSDPDPSVRESAVRIAGYFGYKECADLLVERCHDQEESVRCAAIEHIPYLEDERIVPTLADALKNGTPRVRAAAAAAFAQVEPALAAPHLLDALNDPDSWVRYFAVRSAGRHRSAVCFERIARMAEEDPASQVRIAAIDSLGKFDGPRAASVLESLAEAPDIDMACAALKSLGQISHPLTLPPLLDALRSTEAVRRIEALRSLGERGGESAVQAIQWAAAADTDPEAAQAAIDALARQGSAEAVAALIGLTAEAALREYCVEALSRLGKDKIELIGKGLAHSQSIVRRAVVEALGRMKQSIASELLVKALDDEEASVRLAAVNALAYLGNRSAERKLVTVMRADPDTSVRRAAQKALRR